MENSKIQWCNHTFNPWIGCSKVHEGCANCYAEADMDKRRHRVKWGPKGTRSRTADSYWKEPRKWNRDAEKAGERRRVFCASLADVFEDWLGFIVDASGNELFDTAHPHAPMTMPKVRRDLFALIDATPFLDWLLLTKRPENIRRMWATIKGVEPIFPGMPGPLGQPSPCIIEGGFRKNVWLGTSVSNQRTADVQVPELLNCRDLAPVLFLSLEPLLGPIDLRKIHHDVMVEIDSLTGDHGVNRPLQGRSEKRIDWVIVGGESGHGARPFKIGWARSIIDQCSAAGVPCFVKQLGANLAIPNDTFSEWPRDGDGLVTDGERGNHQGDLITVRVIDRKGGDPEEWPADLCVREFPSIA